MASKGSKSSKKEEANPSLTLDAISTLLERHHEELAAEFKSSFNQLDSKLDTLRQTVDDHGQRVSSLELAVDDLSQRVSDLENICAALSSDNTKLKAKVIDLEGRSRRQNIRILGLPESTESGRPSDFFADLLLEVFGSETLPSKPDIDRAHQTLVAKRPVIVRRKPTLLYPARLRLTLAGGARKWISSVEEQ